MIALQENIQHLVWVATAGAALSNLGARSADDLAIADIFSANKGKKSGTVGFWYTEGNSFLLFTVII